MDFKIIAVDFDGTLCENKFPDIGEPNLELIKHLKHRQCMGDKIVLWTCRTGNKLTEANWFCHGNGLYFDAINENIPEVLEWMGGDSRKIFAHEYIDDRSCTLFKLPFITKKITDETITKIEKTFGFSLYPWQVDYLKGNRSDTPVGDRHTGKTFAYCLRLLLSGSSEHDFSDPRTIRFLVDDHSRGPVYMKWFQGYILELDNWLKLAGFDTNNKKKDKER
jgi:hypothetical protein